MRREREKGWGKRKLNTKQTSNEKRSRYRDAQDAQDTQDCFRSTFDIEGMRPIVISFGDPMSPESQKILLEPQMLIDSLCQSGGLIGKDKLGNDIKAKTNNLVIGYSTKTLRKKYNDVLFLENKINGAPKRLIREKYKEGNMTGKAYYASWLLNYVTAPDRTISDEEIMESDFLILKKLLEAEGFKGKLGVQHDVTLKNGIVQKTHNIATNMLMKIYKEYPEYVRENYQEEIQELKDNGIDLE